MKLIEGLCGLVVASVLAAYTTVPITEVEASQRTQYILGHRDISFFQKIFSDGFKNLDKKFVDTSNQKISVTSEQTGAIYRWFIQNQKNSPLGLVASYPDEPGLDDQAFTYDQALAGLVFLRQGDIESAGKIFRFFYEEWKGEGFWTVYNTRNREGGRIEYMRIMGPNAWIGLFSVHYYKKTNDPRALELATEIAFWIRSLPHRDGGVAMGDGDVWKSAYSVENNLNYYALLQSLFTEVRRKDDQDALVEELLALKKWFRHQAYNRPRGLFSRGIYPDTAQALDSNSWALLVFGVTNLKRDFEIDANFLIDRIENYFAVQNGGDFGQNVLNARGFDFSDANNAGLCQRPGMKWIEGTNQMVLVYKMMRDYYRDKGPSGKSKANYYKARYDHFFNRNGDDAVWQGGTLGFSYTDAPGTQIWSDNPDWRSSQGPSVAASAWVYFALSGINPFFL